MEEDEMLITFPSDFKAAGIPLCPIGFEGESAVLKGKVLTMTTGEDKGRTYAVATDYDEADRIDAPFIRDELLTWNVEG